MAADSYPPRMGDVPVGLALGERSTVMGATVPVLEACRVLRVACDEHPDAWTWLEGLEIELGVAGMADEQEDLEERERLAAWNAWAAQ